MPTLLIAHPDKGLRTAVRQALEAEGHEVVEAGSGDAAVKRAVEAEVAVALVASQLPDTEGVDVCKLLREAPGGTELGLIISGPEFWEPGIGGSVVRASGADGFLAFPCRHSTLLTAVDRALERQGLRTPSPDGSEVILVVEELHSKLEILDYYGLLGLERTAAADAVTRSFHRMSLLFHPDRHMALRGSSVYDRVRAIYKRMTEAYKVLGNPRRREAYDEGLKEGRLRLEERGRRQRGDVDDEARITDSNARKFYRLGREGEAQQDFRAARMNYGFALTYEKENAVIRHSLARMEFALGVRDTEPPPLVDGQFAEVEEAPEPGAEAESEPESEPEPEPEPEAQTEPEPEAPADLPETLPAHVAIIMDGNGRWAEGQGLDRIEGHRKGAAAVRVVTRAARRWGVRHLTLYAFSEQNWGRPGSEVDALMGLLAEYVELERTEIMENGIRLLAIGDIERLHEPAREALQKMIADSAGNRGMTLCLALSYGGREEIVAAVRRACEQAKAGDLDPDSVTVESFGELVGGLGVPDPDLVIRTSGEMRLSNFLLWQIAYAELHVTDTPWPDFGEDGLLEALKDFAARERRFGRTGAQVRGDGEEEA